jgi:hypothetical protein
MPRQGPEGRIDVAIRPQHAKGLRFVRRVVVLALVLAATPARADTLDIWLFGTGAGVGGATIDDPTFVMPLHLGLERLHLSEEVGVADSLRGNALSVRGELLVGGDALILGGSLQYERLVWIGSGGRTRSWGGRGGLYAAPVPDEGTLTYAGAWAVWRYRRGILNVMLSGGLAVHVAGHLERETGMYTPDGMPIIEIDEGPPVVLLLSAEIAAYVGIASTFRAD